jgi:hypothetical protein
MSSTAARTGLLLATLLVAVLYGSTMSRWMGMGDCALLVHDAAHLELSSHANNHRTAIAVGWLFSKLPLGTLAWRLNLMSVVVGTATMAWMYLVSLRLTRHVPTAVLGTLATAVVHTIWWHSTLVENYAFNGLALLVVAWLLLADEEEPAAYKRDLAAVVAGFAVVNHVQMGLLVPTVGGYALLRAASSNAERARRVLRSAAWWCVGASPYFLSLVVDAVRSGDPRKTVFWALGGSFQERMLSSMTLSDQVRDVLVQFPSAFLVLAPVGVVVLVRTRRDWRAHLAMAAGWAVNTAFFASYNTWDRFAFLLPSVLWGCVWAVVGWDALRRWASTRGAAVQAAAWGVLASCVLTPPLFYATLADWSHGSDLFRSSFTSNSTTNTHQVGTYLANPNKAGWSDMDEVAMLLMEELPPGAVFIDDDARLYYSLERYYHQHLGLRPDLQLRLYNSWGYEGWGDTLEELLAETKAQLAAGGRVFVVSLEPPHRELIFELAEHHDIVPRRFDLDPYRWVYELVDDPRDGAQPIVLEARTRTRRGVRTRHFGPDDVVVAELNFLRLFARPEGAVRWRDPSGAVVAEQAVRLQPTTFLATAELPEDAPFTVGRWTVEFLADGEVVGSTPFWLSRAPGDRSLR